MAVTRTAVQGFIDGLKAAGNDLSTLSTIVTTWLTNDPVYSQDGTNVQSVVDDLNSYRK